MNVLMENVMVVADREEQVSLWRPLKEKDDFNSREGERLVFPE